MTCHIILRNVAKVYFFCQIFLHLLPLVAGSQGWPDGARHQASMTNDDLGGAGREETGTDSLGRGGRAQTIGEGLDIINVLLRF